MKHIQSNELQIRDVLQVYIFCVELPEVKVKHCGLLPLTQSEAGARDQENFVENSINHDR